MQPATQTGDVSSFSDAPRLPGPEKTRTSLFDTVTGKFEKGPYFPKDESRISWETKTREFFDVKLKAHQTKTNYVLDRPEARILIYGGRGGLQVEASLPSFCTETI